MSGAAGIDPQTSRNYKHAARIIRRALNERPDHLSRITYDWPESSDPTLDEALSKLVQWLEPEIIHDPAGRPLLRRELQQVAESLEAGRPLSDSLTHRLWRWSVVFSDHRNGILFLALALGIIGTIIYVILASARI